MSAFERHPKKTLFAFLLFFLLLIAGLFELTLRFILPYDIGYYMAVREKGVYSYPYGDVQVNSAGFPDTEFDTDSPKKRIGYFGDSVTFGVGAGAGYRFSDLLEQRFPKYEHWTFSMLSNGIQDLSIVEMAEKYDLDGAVYAFNLNDIVPEIKGNVDAPENEMPLLYKAQRWVKTKPDQFLRGKSYLYTWLRTGIKNTLIRFGVATTGFKAVELYPAQNQDLIKQVAQRVNDINTALAAKGVRFCLLILPYEMQISKDAALTYADLGIDWEEGFESGSTQDALKNVLRFSHVYDGREAFKGVYDTAQVGEYFVYNKGDKIDFNHPNRKGHAVLTEGLIKSKSCSFYK